MLYLLGIVWAFASCQSDAGKKQTFEGVLQYDSLTVEIDFPFLGTYQCLAPVFHQDTLYAAGCNRFTNNIDMLNLSGGKHREIVVEPKGPNGVQMPLIFRFDKGKFIVRDNTGMTVMGMNGKVIRRYPVEDLNPSVSTQYSHRPFGGDLAGNTLIEAYNGEALVPLTIRPLLPTSSVGAVLDVEKETFRLLPIYYPEGIQAFPYLMPCEDRLILSFHSTSQVYVYDRASKELTNIRIGDSLEDGVKASRNNDDSIDRRRYREVHYSPKLHKYYRFVLGTGEWRGKRSKTERTPSYLVVYDEHTGESREYELPMTLSVKQNIVHDDILYIAFRNDADDFFKFAKIDIAKL